MEFSRSGLFGSRMEDALRLLDEIEDILKETRRMMQQDTQSLLGPSNVGYDVGVSFL